MKERDTDLLRLHAMARMNVANLTSDERLAFDKEYSAHVIKCQDLYGLDVTSHALWYGWVPDPELSAAG